MNDALTQYGYPKDAILSPALATTLAKNIQARYIVTSTLAKAQGKGYTVTARIHGVNDDAGNVVAVAQTAGGEPAGLREAGWPRRWSRWWKRADEAKACIDQRTAKPDKAAEAAQQGHQGRAESRARPLLSGAARPGQEGCSGRGREGAPGLGQGRPAEPAGLDRAGDPVSAGQRHGEHPPGLQADAACRADQPEAARGAVQVLPPVGSPGDGARSGGRGAEARPVQRRPLRPEEQRLPLPEQLQVRGGCAGDDVRHRFDQGGHALLHQDLGRRGRG